VISSVANTFFTTKAPGKGTGLVLATSAIAQLNGTISWGRRPGGGNGRGDTAAIRRAQGLRRATRFSTTPMHDRPTILLVDDDAASCATLGDSLASRGFDVRIASSGGEANRLIDHDPPEYAIVDLRLPDGHELKLISALRAANARTRIVVLTGHENVPTAVEAIKLGAAYYLAKPVDVEVLIRAFHLDRGSDDAPLTKKPMSLKRLEWEQIQRVLHEQGGNISATARALSMHRRTLQRKMAKRRREA
jgi:two-component system response regulator RegA